MCRKYAAFCGSTRNSIWPVMWSTGNARNGAALDLSLGTAASVDPARFSQWKTSTATLPARRPRRARVDRHRTDRRIKALQALLDHSEQALLDAADVCARQPAQRAFQYQH